MNTNDNKDMNMNNSEEGWVDVKNKMMVSKFHPCQYCGKSCAGLQCKECHLKMVNERNADCVDCGINFYAVKKDGTKRKRCFDCQEKFNGKHYKNCPDCKNSFRFTLDNGKVFDKCGDCYKSQKKNEEEEKKRKEEEKIMNDCKRCKKEKTLYDLCRNCFREQKEITDQYMLSRCVGCGQRYKGTFKYCGGCKRK